MKINDILLVCAGDIDYKLLSEYADKVDYIIAIDGGYSYLKDINIIPNIFIGDFDSNLSKLSSDVPIIKLKTEKDESDTEVALRYALDLCPNNIFILGATGKRLDHFLFNLNILFIALNKANCYIIDSKNRIFLSNSYASVSGKYKYFSVYPFSDIVEGLTISGAKYNVDNICITGTDSYTLSNESTDDTDIRIRKGLILVIESDDTNVYR